MKKRNLFLTLGLALTLGAGVAGGLSLNRGEVKEAREVSAAHADDGHWYIAGSTTKGGFTWDAGLQMPANGSYTGQLIVELEAGDQFKFKYDNAWDTNLGAGAVSAGTGNANGYFSGSDNVVVDHDGFYRISVTQDKKVDIDLCKSKTVVADIKTGTIYVKELSAANLYVYTYEDFGGYEFKLNGDWHGTEVTTKTQATNYDPFKSTKGFVTSNNGLYKVDFKYASLSDVGVIVNTSSYQTKNLVVGASADNELELVLNAYYYGKDNNLWDDFTYNASAGSAAALIYETESKLFATTNDSICEVSQSDASTLVASYNGLNATAKGYVDGATVYTWKSTEKTGDKINHNYSDVFVSLNKVAAGAGSFVINNNTESNNITPIVIVLATTIGLIAVASFFVIRRRKEQE